MKISTRGRYALRLMIDIAQQNTEEPKRTSKKVITKKLSQSASDDFLSGSLADALKLIEEAGWDE